MKCTNDRYGPVCERTDSHDGSEDPHRNGELIWHDPPLILVGGERVPPLTEHERELIARFR